ncbi:MAG: pyruvate, phosphate dikinase [Vulcanimicrobiaceae bacterium]
MSTAFDKTAMPRATQGSESFIVFFEKGDASQKNLLGGKGAGLAEMTRAGLPVPPGFTITTEACLRYYELGGKMPPGLTDAVHDAMHELERRSDKGFGDPKNPLLVSVRSGARVSMPGMMDTILNLGLNDATVAGLAALADNERFAWDAYRRFAGMFAHIVLHIHKEKIDEITEEHLRRAGVKHDYEVTAQTWRDVVADYKDLILRESKRPFPQEVYEQLDLAVGAVFNSWNSKRAIEYRRFHKISDDWGTAVNVVTMVFGNLGDDSGTGVAFTRDPSTGEKKLFGEYLRNAQGEDVVAGIRTPEKIADLQSSQPEIFRQFEDIAGKLERHYRDVQDLEFTVERGKLYMLQTRSAKRSAEAAVKIALDFIREGILDEKEALQRVDAASLDQLFHARIDPKQQYRVAGKGLSASPGAAAGEIALDPDTAVEWAKEGKKVVLVRMETNPDDVHGIIAAEGVLTARGGATSHAAVVARGMGKPCVAGLDSLQIDRRAKSVQLDGQLLHEGDEITIDGTTGNVIVGKLALIMPDKMPKWLEEFLALADKHKTLGVWANADTPGDAKRARELGATGIGLTRTEHMFMQRDRLPIVQQMILAKDYGQRKGPLARLLEFQREDFKGILSAMEGMTVTIRLLDPPLHEFLPDMESLLVETTELRLTKGEEDAQYRKKMKVLQRVRELHEQNPMLGLRVCRLGILYPDIYAMQVRAIFEAAVDLRKNGVDARPDVMIPGVGTEEEMKVTRDAVKAIADEIIASSGVDVPYQIGTMIELPRACVIADRLAKDAEFFSFGTNDLTQTTFGYSRDDAEGTFIPYYLDHKILKTDPFQALDRDGVGVLMQIGIEKGRGARPNLKIGICGEHGGDPSSVAFCNEIGLDYVSCSPYRVPIARLAAAQAAVSGTHSVQD